ncbi:MAG: ABC transporter permease [Acidobacteriota bacterium]
MLHVAWREFVSTVATKGFIVGVLISPAIMGVVVLILPLLIDPTPPKIDGELAILDPTGEVADGVREALKPEELARQRIAISEKIDEVMPASIRELTKDPAASEAVGQALEAALGEVPELRVVTLPAGSDLEAEKGPLREGEVTDGGRLALVVIDPEAIEPGKDGAYGTFELFVREKLDDRLESEIKDAVKDVIVDGRLSAQGLDPAEITTMTRIGRVASTTVSLKGERETSELLNLLLPVGFMVLLLISVMTGGQYLLTTTIEEKSSRVVEVLLSAVSPMELMTGKILGQLAVGLSLLVLYTGLGFAALLSFSVLGLINPWLIVYLVIFYFIAYFVLASMMAAIGAAVNEMREAQTLMTPVMLVVMIPWLLWMPITRDPNGVFATVTSMLPPINSFVMLLRMTSTAPPPMWQVWLSILIGVVSVFVCLWIAAKVFRIGLLLHGKPPNLRTLWRWVRMA